MNDRDLSYKIIILALLEHAGFRMTSSQLSDFMIEFYITDYFSAMQAIASLDKSGLIDGVATNNITYYTINKKGAEALRLFPEKINSEIQSDINKYFEKNGSLMKQSNGLTADYTKIDENNFLVSLRCREDDNIIIDLAFRVPSEDAARSVCTNWRVRYEDIYAAILDKLI